MRRVALAFALALTLLAPAGASAWAPASSATIHPGVQTFTDGAQCTANFVFSGGGTTYLGQAAHCAGTGGATDTDGCTSQSLPLGTPVEVTGASRPGTLAYSSWLAMQASNEKDPDTCAYNDLALVRIDAADVGKVNPSVPGFGGPTGVGAAASGDDVFSYGNSELRGGASPLSPKQGKVVAVDGGGWSYNVYTVSPGVPGDSGSGFLNASGQAIGVLSTLDALPLPGSNGVGALAREVAYMHAHGNGANVVAGTEAFNGSLSAAMSGMRSSGASSAPAAQRQGASAPARHKARRHHRRSKRHRASRRASRRAHARHHGPRAHTAR